MREIGLIFVSQNGNNMYVTFEKQYLKDLYEKGKTDDKKHRYQPDIVKRYQKCIKFLWRSKSLEELMRIHSLNYEVLKGDKKGISSIRVNNKYRIEFTVKETWEEAVITVCNVIELSNHYK